MPKRYREYTPPTLSDEEENEPPTTIRRKSSSPIMQNQTLVEYSDSEEGKDFEEYYSIKPVRQNRKCSDRKPIFMKWMSKNCHKMCHLSSSYPYCLTT